MEALAPLEHTKQQYEEFAKDFYEAAPEIAAMSEAEVRVCRSALLISIAMSNTFG